MSQKQRFEETARVTALPNGVRVVSDHMPGFSSTVLGVWFGAGSRHERPEQNGVAHFLEHMAFKGTSRRSAQAIAEEIESVGGELNAYTSLEATAYYARVLKEDTGLAFDILADILRDPLFQAEDVELERGVILQEIGGARDTPDELIFDWAQEVGFPDQPIGRAILGSTENVSGFDRDALSGFMAERYGPDRLVVSAAGAVDHDALVALAERAFGDLRPRPDLGAQPSAYRGGERREIKDLEQAHVVLGFAAPGYGNDDYLTAQAYATLLGGGLSSRLFQEVREKRGLCYTIYAHPSHYADGGFLTVYAGCGGEDVAELLDVSADQLKDLASNVSEDELDRAKAQLRASTLMGLEAPFARAERAARNLLNFGRIRPVDEVLATLDAINRAGLRDFAASLLRDHPPTLALYGPVAGAPAYDALRERLAA